MIVSQILLVSSRNADGKKHREAEMCLDNKEHAIYRICKNDTIGPGSNLPFGFTEQIEIVILFGVAEWHVV